MLDEARRCQVDLIGGGFKSYHQLSASLLYLTYSHQRYREFKYSLIMKFKLFFAEKSSHSNNTFTHAPKKIKKLLEKPNLLVSKHEAQFWPNFVSQCFHPALYNCHKCGIPSCHIICTHFIHFF